MAFETGKMTGTIKWINEVKTFGLITPDGSSDEVFASFPAREDEDPSGGLSVKQKVSYDLEPGLHGGRAINVAKIA
jgi:cold shock protein